MKTLEIPVVLKCKCYSGRHNIFLAGKIAFTATAKDLSSKESLATAAFYFSKSRQNSAVVLPFLSLVVALLLHKCFGPNVLEVEQKNT